MSKIQNPQQLFFPLVYPNDEQVNHTVSLKNEVTMATSAKIIYFQSKMVSDKNERIHEEKMMLLAAAKQLKW